MHSASLCAEPRIERMEPANWWTGMASPELQVLVHGPLVGTLEPQVDYQGVRLDRVVRTENPNYLFLYLQLDPDCPAGELKIQFVDGDKGVLHRSLPLWEREPGSSERKGYGPSDVIYLITPDRFANGNPDNDNVEGMGDPANRQDPFGRHGGDLAGIRQHLDYIKGMGFTAIWICPVLENSMPEQSYHGYAITDFYKVDPRFGSNGEYRQLVREAGARGIKVIMDQVVNHCGTGHWFIRDLPSQDWINFPDEIRISNHRRTTNQDLHASERDRRLMSDGWFVTAMPDLNQRNALLADYLVQNSIWWVEYAGLSGIRMDTWPYPDKAFMADWSCAIMEEYPGFNMVGEEWSGEPAIVSYWQRGKHNADGYSTCLPGLIDFPLQFALKAALNHPEDHGKGWIEFYEKLALDFLYPDPDNLVTLLDNHDMDRFFTQVDEDPARFRLGLALLLTMRGIPQVYYGTEVLMSNTGYPENHGVIRTEFPGGWPDSEANAFTGKGLSMEQQATMEWLRRLLNWRKGNRAIHEGRLMHFAPADGVYVYFRYTGKEAVMVALNKEPKGRTLALDRFAERLEGYASGTDPMTGKVVPLEGSLPVPASSALILELSPAPAE